MSNRPKETHTQTREQAQRFHRQITPPTEPPKQAKWTSFRGRLNPSHLTPREGRGGKVINTQGGQQAFAEMKNDFSQLFIRTLQLQHQSELVDEPRERTTSCWVSRFLSNTRLQQSVGGAYLESIRFVAPRTNEIRPTTTGNVASLRMVDDAQQKENNQLRAQ